MSYIKIIPTTTKFYRSSRNQTDISGYWFGLTPESTFGYGSITAEFIPKRSLLLIDITHNDFYNDFVNKLKTHSDSNPNIETLQNTLLFPIGFFSSDIYLKFASTIGLTINNSQNMNVELNSQLYNNRYRCSVKDIDLLLMDYLKNSYPNYDGIIANKKLPNLIMNGFHHPEMALFDNTIIKLDRIIQHAMPGGGDLKEIKTNEYLTAIDFTSPFIEQAKKLMSSLTYPKEIISAKRNKNTRKIRNNNISRVKNLL